MKYTIFASAIIAASVVSALPTKRQSTSGTSDARVQFSDQATESGSQLSITVGSLTQVNKEVSTMFVVSGPAGVVCQAFSDTNGNSAIGEPATTEVTAEITKPIKSVLCEIGNGNGNDNDDVEEDVQEDEDDNAGATFRLQIDRDTNGEAVQQEFTAGVTILASDRPFSTSTDIVGLSLSGSGTDALACNVNYINAAGEDKSADFDAQTPFSRDDVVTFVNAICV